MASSRRVAGTCYITADNAQLAVRGNVNVSLSKVERTGIAGLDKTHGYMEKPRVQFIELDVTTTPDLSIEDLDAMDDVTVVAALANGKSYSLFNAWTKGPHEVNGEQGQLRVRFEGMDGSEF